MNDRQGLGEPLIDSDERRMAQIRELLFGEQARDTERRLAELTARIEAQDAALRTALHEQEARSQTALAALRAPLDEETAQRRLAVDELDRSLRRELEHLQDGLVRLDSDIREAGTRFDQGLVEQAQALQRLEASTASRERLAGLLEALARELRGSGA